MNARTWAVVSMVCLVCFGGVACDTAMQDTEVGLPPPDGIDPKNPNTERSTHQIDFTGVETVRIELPTGDVEITQGDGSGATLKVTEIVLIEGLSPQDLESLLLSSEVTAQRSFVDDSRLDIEADVANTLADTDILFQIELSMPAGANVEVILDTGPVEVSSLSGNVEVRTHGAGVTLDGVVGNVVARTSGAPIEAKDIVGNVQVETSDADISMLLAPPENGSVSAETVNGTIDIRVAIATAASVSLSATEGSVSANLSGFEISGISFGPSFFEGVVNGGGGQIEANTSGGDISFAGM